MDGLVFNIHLFKFFYFNIVSAYTKVTSVCRKCIYQERKKDLMFILLNIM